MKPAHSLAALSVVLAASFSFASDAHAESASSYPLKPVRWIVGFPPGGPADIFSRLMGQWLTERLGQPFVIENRPGAAGNLAVETVARSPADGYTLLQVGPPNAINASLYDKLGFDFVRDIAPVANIAQSPNVLIVHPTVPARSVPEFVAYAKSHPGLSMASSGNGTVTHVAGELFKMMTGIALTHVPYRGSAPALADLVGGQAQSMFDNLPSSIGYIRNGKLRALAVTTAARSPQLPDVPAVAEFLPGFEASSWFGVGAPRKTPAAIVERLNREINDGLDHPPVAAKIEALGATVVHGSASEFASFIARETEKWAKVVRYSGAKPD
jgi:tripartite-type tricarboxylate transporter receptor subunit TctC